MMKNLKELVPVIVMLLIVATLVFVRTSNKNRFRETTEKITEALKNEIVFVQVKGLQVSDYLVIELGENPDGEKFPASLKVSFEEISGKDFRKNLETSEKKILLTGEASQTAKAWVILNQLGYKNVFILTTDENPEVLKYKFQPVTN